MSLPPDARGAQPYSTPDPVRGVRRLVLLCVLVPVLISVALVWCSGRG